MVLFSGYKLSNWLLSFTLDFISNEGLIGIGDSTYIRTSLNSFHVAARRAQRKSGATLKKERLRRSRFRSLLAKSPRLGSVLAHLS